LWAALWIASGMVMTKLMPEAAPVEGQRAGITRATSDNSAVPIDEDRLADWLADGIENGVRTGRGSLFLHTLQ